eukprot:777620-Prorocentrum_minimum.AAC.3
MYMRLRLRSRPGAAHSVLPRVEEAFRLWVESGRPIEDIPQLLRQHRPCAQNTTHTASDFRRGFQPHPTQNSVMLNPCKADTG